MTQEIAKEIHNKIQEIIFVVKEPEAQSQEILELLSLYVEEIQK